MKSTIVLLYCLVLSAFWLKVDAKSVLIAQQNEILQLDTSNNSWTLLVLADSQVKAFDLQPVWQQLFWATDYMIYRTPLYDLNTTTTLASTGRVGSLAVDWVHKHVYWTDLDRRRVEGMNLEGRYRRVLYTTHGELGSLAVDPHKGKLFWLERHPEESNVTYIKSTTSASAASRVQVVFSSDVIQPDSPLVVDPGYNSIYFYQTNNSLSQQWEINYGGIQPHIKLFERKDPDVKSLALAGKFFYFANSEGLFLGKWLRKRYTLVYGNNTDDFLVLDPYFELINENLTEVSQLRVLTKETQRSPVDDCSSLFCEQECLMDFKPLCSCRYGYILNSDNRSCSEQGYLVYEAGTTIGRIKLDRGDNMVLYNDSFANIQSFDVLVKTAFIYWADLLKQAILRAPVENPTRSEIVVSNVSAYGISIDWVHDRIYWTDQNSIVVSTLDGTKKTVLLDNLDAPAEIAVDPINRYIFWAECGRSLSLKRAGLAGNDVTVVRSHVTCGTALYLGAKYRTLYWRDWTGAVHSCGYDGSYISRIQESLTDLAVWSASDEDTSTSVDDIEELLSTKFQMLKSQDVEVNSLKLFSSKRQPQAPIVCETIDCAGLCFPSPTLAEPRCLCTDAEGVGRPCKRGKSLDAIPGVPTLPHLEVVDVTPFSVTLRCAGVLLRHPFFRPFLAVTEVDSLVPRVNLSKTTRMVQVADKSIPFTIDSLNPATSYSISVRNRVTRASFVMTVTTAPPPLTVLRLPLVTITGAESPVTWRPQGVHFFSPNPWESLVSREFLLILISANEYSLVSSVYIKPTLIDLLQKRIKGNFVVLKHYKSEEEFDDDPEMYLGNLPWGEEFWVAMVQVTEFNQVYNLDMVYSDKFNLPDPYWNSLIHDILDDY